MGSLISNIVSKMETGFIDKTSPSYAYLRIMPHTSNRNYDSSSIAELISGMYRDTKDRVEKLPKGWKVEDIEKCGYYIEIYCDKDGNKNAEFYMMLPYQHLERMKVKVESTWKGCDAQIVDNFKNILDEPIKAAYELKYRKHSAYSLKIDKRDNNLLASSLSVIGALKNGERVGIYYNFIPTAQSNWKNTYKSEIDRLKGNKKVGGMQGQIRGALQDVLDSGMQGLSEGLMGTSSKGSQSKQNNMVIEIKQAINKSNLELNKFTKNKKDSHVIDVQILVVGVSDDINRAVGNAKYVANGFNCIDSDNQLEPYRIKDKQLETIELGDSVLRYISKNTISMAEAHNFIQIPGEELLKKYGIAYNRINEVLIPNEFLNGYLSFGYSKLKGKMVKIYVSTDKEVRCMPYLLLGPQGCGKTTDLENYIVTAADNDDAVVCIDFIKACELSKHSMNYIKDPSKVLLVDLSRREYYQSFAFNESSKYRMKEFDEDNNVIETDNIRSRIISANQQCALMTNFIDSINRDEELTATMLKGFKAMCNIVFLFDGTSLKDVVDGLLDHEIRHQFIDRVPEEYFEEVPELYYDVDRLEELDEYDKDGVLVGTQAKLVNSAVSRISRLMDNMMFREMLFKNPDNNIDFVEAMDSGKAIFICMPQDVFQDETSRNILTTFFVSKVMFAAKLLGGINANLDKENRLTHLIIDEPYQTPNILPLFKANLNQLRKFRLKPVMSMHFINQLKELVDYLDTAGASYSFYRGSIKADFEKYQEMLAPFDFSHILNLPKWHALNLVKGVESEDRIPFITQHFKPVYESGVPMNNFKELEKERFKHLQEISKQERVELNKQFKEMKLRKEQLALEAAMIRQQEEEEEKASKKKKK